MFSSLSSSLFHEQRKHTIFGDGRCAPKIIGLRYAAWNLRQLTASTLPRSDFSHGVVAEFCVFAAIIFIHVPVSCADFASTIAECRFQHD